MLDVTVPDMPQIQIAIGQRKRVSHFKIIMPLSGESNPSLSEAIASLREPAYGDNISIAGLEVHAYDDIETDPACSFLGRFVPILSGGANGERHYQRNHHRPDWRCRSARQDYADQSIQ